jgi:hypothetical protein
MDIAPSIFYHIKIADWITSDCEPSVPVLQRNHPQLSQSIYIWVPHRLAAREQLPGGFPTHPGSNAPLHFCDPHRKAWDSLAKEASALCKAFCER